MIIRVFLGGSFYKGAIPSWGPRKDPNLENYPYGDVASKFKKRARGRNMHRL